MGVFVEGLGHSPPEVRAESDVFFKTRPLLWSISTRAHTIAVNVRKNGEQTYGPAWARGYAVLPDGRTVSLQQSLEEVHRGQALEQALEIHIPYSPVFQHSIHIRYNLQLNVINAYEVRQADSTPITAYWIFDRPDKGTRVPANLLLHEIVNPVDEILKLVEPASKTIMWTAPERTPSASLRPVRCIVRPGF
jgi:hypothetical protein